MLPRCLQVTQALRSPKLQYLTQPAGVPVWELGRLADEARRLGTRRFLLEIDANDGQSRTLCGGQASSVLTHL
jgi:hypothetical protein